jgi:hypothetical protein
MFIFFKQSLIMGAVLLVNRRWNQQKKLMSKKKLPYIKQTHYGPGQALRDSGG